MHWSSWKKQNLSTLHIDHSQVSSLGFIVYTQNRCKWNENNPNYYTMLIGMSDLNRCFILHSFLFLVKLAESRPRQLWFLLNQNFSYFLSWDVEFESGHTDSSAVDFVEQAATAFATVRKILSSPIKDGKLDAWSFSITTGPGFASTSWFQR